MRAFGFSTGALALGDFSRALEILESVNVQAIELSALRQGELDPLLSVVKSAELSRFQFISVHAPSVIEEREEARTVEKLKQFAHRKWPIVVHPDTIHDSSPWRELGPWIYVENMDKRKRIGRTDLELDRVFRELLGALMCFDIAHARQVDTSMVEAYKILKRFHQKIRELHISEVNTSSWHDRLSPMVVSTYHELAPMIPSNVPIILETPARGSQIDEQLQMAESALSWSEIGGDRTGCEPHPVMHSS
jgi:hypothetical protein